MGTRHGASALAAKDAGDWVQAHAALSRLAHERAALDAEEGRWLLCAWRSAAHVHLGYGSFAQYIERLFGYKPRTTQEKLRVAEALETLPRLARALEAGALSWCAARELTRVAVPETEPSWLDAARGKTLRELETLVASKAPGDAPDAPAPEPPRSRVLRFEVAADTFATFREAMLRLQRLAGRSLDDDALLLQMARHVLSGPRDDGRSSYQISLSVCGACGCGAQQAGGELVPIEAAVVAMATCDAQQLAERVSGVGELRAANENARLDADAIAGAQGGAHDAFAVPSADESSATRRSSDHAHVGAQCRPVSTATPSVAACTTPPTRTARSDAHPRPRAKQSIPPALRRAVLTRDRHRCRVPGCTHATFVDVHHVQPRSEGGRNEASNLVVLCSAHHRATHRGGLLLHREREGAFTFRHPDGAAYGSPTAPRLVDAHAKVFAALRHLGFRESEVKTVLGELRADAELDGTSVEQLLREALCRIRPMAR
jgi:5-methylcytosine-specific restriction endonuclease McrA